ncbi:MAG: hypothetical protein ABGY43_02705 [bacterium]
MWCPVRLSLVYLFTVPRPKGDHFVFIQFGERVPTVILPKNKRTLFSWEQLDQDKVVWDRQRYIEQPQLCAGDGPIIDFRDFFRQFYAGGQRDKYRDSALKRKISR